MRTVTDGTDRVRNRQAWSQMQLSYSAEEYKDSFLKAFKRVAQRFSGKPLNIQKLLLIIVTEQIWSFQMILYLLF